MAQLTARSHQIPEGPGSNPALLKYCHLSESSAPAVETVSVIVTDDRRLPGAFDVQLHGELWKRLQLRQAAVERLAEVILCSRL